LVRLIAVFGVDATRARARLQLLMLAILAAVTCGTWIFILRVWLDTLGVSGHSRLWRGLALTITLAAVLAVLLANRQIGHERLQRLGNEIGKSGAIFGGLLALLLGLAAPFLSKPSLPNPQVRERQIPHDGSITTLKTAPGPDILLITFDALSARDISLYGYDRDTTPGLSRFSQRAHVFTHAYSSANFTTPAVSSMLTASRPWKHRVFQLQAFLLGDEKARNPIQSLRDAGYTTIAYTSNPAANPKQNRTSGSFDIVHDDRSHYLKHSIYTSLTRSQGLDTQNLLNLFPWTHATAALDTLRRRFDAEPYRQSPAQMLAEAREAFTRLAPGGKVFMWIHVWVPHHYYMPPEPYLYRFAAERQLDDFDSQAALPREYSPQDQALAQLARARYDENIAYAEHLVSEFLAQLDSGDCLDDSIVAIAADHGEMFEKGIIGHGGNALYDPMIHIPLLIRTPRQTARQFIEAPAEQIDIMPTLLDLAGVPLRFEVEGRSLLSAMRGDTTVHPVASMWFERESAFAPLKRGSIALIDWPWKIIFDLEPGGRTELYDLANDPDERIDHATRDASRAQALRERAMMMLKSAESPRGR
jgi:arylsulfatase A-like enzyme